MNPGRIVLAGVFVLAGALRAEGASVSLAHPGETLEAGQTVEVRIKGVPEGVDEYELLLVSGHDHAVKLRLTESRNSDSESFFWTVPNLSLPEAALVLRMGGNGRETESEPSPSFAITGRSSTAVASLELRRGEIWVDEDEGACDSPDELPAPSYSPEPARLVSSRSHESLLPPDPDPHDLASGETAGPGFAVTTRPTRSLASLALSRTPLSFPRRN